MQNGNNSLNNIINAVDAEIKAESDNTIRERKLRKKRIFIGIGIALIFAGLIALIYTASPTRKAKQYLTAQVSSYFESIGLLVEKVELVATTGYLTDDYSYQITASMADSDYNELKEDPNGLVNLLFPENGHFRGKSFSTSTSSSNLKYLSCGVGTITINGDKYKYQMKDLSTTSYTSHKREHSVACNGSAFWNYTESWSTASSSTSSGSKSTSGSSKKTGACSGGSVGCRAGWHPCHEMSNGYCNMCCHD